MAQARSASSLVARDRIHWYQAWVRFEPRYCCPVTVQEFVIGVLKHIETHGCQGNRQETEGHKNPQVPRPHLPMLVRE